MKAWLYSPNTYDVNLVKRHDDNSAINSNRSGQLLHAHAVALCRGGCCGSCRRFVLQPDRGGVNTIF